MPQLTQRLTDDQVKTIVTQFVRFMANDHFMYITKIDVNWQEKEDGSRGEFSVKLELDELFASEEEAIAAGAMPKKTTDL